ncbi:Hypothetical protein AA314_05084 [Archangium gephyra]|uniref:Peptidase metallopeptidase domain-containing protein n=1 Tax=Archangium gephyra TaxID=48 RepID=A0AAC8QA78_9BACT|nr:Hypothetical protein AA314_05084 [Archangium gephyra]
MRLEIRGREPETEISVIDSSFRTLECQMDHLVTELPPGLYKIRFRVGPFLQELHQALEPGSQGVLVEAPWMRFDSPAPLANTRLTHEYHEEAAEKLSRSDRVHVQLGAGSRLFVFTRDWELKGEGHPANGLSLHDVEGRLLVEFWRAGEQGGAGLDAWAACHLELKPGSYRLRVDAGPEGVFEQIIVTCAGWQTQVFLLRTRYGVHDDAPWRPDLSNASILMEHASQDRGFQAWDERLRLAELARLSLGGRQPYLLQKHLGELLKGKFENPMLGLYAAHALLENRTSAPASVDSHRPLLHEVVSNLQGLIPGHPDVEALRLWLELVSPETLSGRYASPPMLRGSWSIIVEKTGTHPALIPADSLAARISRNVWGSSPWLIWQLENAPAPHRVATPFMLEMLGSPAGEASPLESLELLSFLSADSALSMEPERGAEWDEVEESLLELLRRKSSRGALRGASPDTRSLLASLETLTLPQLVRHLELPSSTVEAAVSKLREKLREQHKARVLRARMGPPRPSQPQKSLGLAEGLHVCIDRSEGQPRDALARRSWMKSRGWAPGRVLRVGFLDGDPVLQERVRHVASLWTQEADVRFRFEKTAEAEIRISFRERGSWSFVGTDCLRVPRSQPTMNFGWLTLASPDPEVSAVVLHEFGHALGCLHEHHTPPGGIAWNKQAIYACFQGAPTFWTREEVDRHFFGLYEQDLTVHDQSDTRSIMLNPIPPEFTLNGFHVGFNTRLSERDKAFIRQLYP